MTREQLARLYVMLNRALASGPGGWSEAWRKAHIDPYEIATIQAYRNGTWPEWFATVYPMIRPRTEPEYRSERA